MARPCGCSGTCNCLIRVCPESTSLEITGVGSAANPYVICQDLDALCADLQNDGCVLAALTVADSDTIDMTLQGDGSQANPWEVSGTVILTPDANVPVPDGGTPRNIIEFGPTGIYVSCEDVQDCVGDAVAGLLDGLEYDDANNALRVAISTDPNNTASYGSDGGIFAAGACVSTDAGNQLTTGTDGCLFVPANMGAAIVAQADNTEETCVNTTVTGDGTAANPLTIAAAPVLAPVDPCRPNVLECTPTGLQAIQAMPRAEFRSVQGPDQVSNGLALNNDIVNLGDEMQNTAPGVFNLRADGCVEVLCDGLYDVSMIGAHYPALQTGAVAWQNNVRLQQLRVRLQVNGANSGLSADIQVRPPTAEALSYPNDSPELEASMPLDLVAGDVLCIQVTRRHDVAGQPIAAAFGQLRMTRLGDLA